MTPLSLACFAHITYLKFGGNVRRFWDSYETRFAVNKRLKNQLCRQKSDFLRTFFEDLSELRALTPIHQKSHDLEKALEYQLRIEIAASRRFFVQY